MSELILPADLTFLQANSTLHLSWWGISSVYIHSAADAGTSRYIYHAQ